jgi:hypothetical protein
MTSTFTAPARKPDRPAAATAAPPRSMTTRALAFNEDDSEFLFMIRTPDGLWHADLTMLDYWRTTVNTPSQINIYNLIGLDDMFCSINHIGAPTELHALPVTEYDRVRSLVARPWIPARLIYKGIPLSDIAAFDAWSRAPTTAPADPAWNHYFRPILADMPLRAPWEPYLLTAPPPPPSAPAPPQPQQQARNAAAVAALPPHVVNTLLAAAVAAGATCPITMEPIDAATATVTPCGHVFTSTALRRWLVTHAHCPECRGPLAATTTPT